MSKAPDQSRVTGRMGRGFTSAAHLLQARIRAAGEARGFAVARLLTHWEEIVGPAVAGACRPVEVRYGREGMGATLTLLTTGPMAPMVEMQKPRIIERVNACYGYRAIVRLRVTQTAPTGFAEGQVAFAPKPRTYPVQAQVTDAAQKAAEGVADTELRLALAALAANVQAKHKG